MQFPEWEAGLFRRGIAFVKGSPGLKGIQQQRDQADDILLPRGHSQCARLLRHGDSIIKLARFGFRRSQRHHAPRVALAGQLAGSLSRYHRCGAVPCFRMWIGGQDPGLF